MAASSLSTVSKVTEIASFSIPLCSKPSNLSLDNVCLRRIPIHFRTLSKPKKILKSKLQYRNSLSFSLFCLASSSFESIETTQDTETIDPPPETETEQKEENGDAVESLTVEAGRLYVGNLPYAMSSSQVSEVFSEAGNIVSVEIVYDRVTDRSRGFAFVTMGSVEEAKEAIKLFDGAQVGGRTVKVNFPEVPRGGEREVMGPKIRSSYQGFVDSPHKIYAGNLCWGLTSQGLREAFAAQPGFLSAKVIYDRASGRSRGFGFITFSSAEDVESALNAMNEVEVEGRPLRLNIAEQRAPTSPPQILESNSESDTESNEMLSSISA